MAKQISEEAKKSLNFIKKAYQDGDDDVIGKIEAIVGLPVKLTGDLLEAYEALGDTPLQVPSLEMKEEDFSDKDEFIFTLADKVGSTTGVKDSDYSIEEYTSFMMKCYKKVNSFLYENGDAKTTPLTENAKLPTFSDLKAIRTIISDTQSRLQDLGDYDSDIGDAAEYIDAINIINKEGEKKMIALAYRVTGVKAKGLTDWEKALLRTNLVAHATNGLSSGFGRSL